MCAEHYGLGARGGCCSDLPLVLFLPDQLLSSPPQGGKSCWFSVVASSRVPVHVTSLEKADSVYEKHAGHVLLGVRLVT